MSNFQNLSNFLPTGVFDSLQSASNAPAPEPVGLLQEGQLRELQETAKRKFPHLSFEQPAAKWRQERVLKLRRIITDAENKLRVWKREVTVVEQPAAFDNAISSLYHELNLTQRIERDRNRARRRLPIGVRFIADPDRSSSSSSSSSEESEESDWQNPADFPDEPEPAHVPVPPVARVAAVDYSDWRCVICLNDDNTNVVEVACGHAYHHHCLMGLISSSGHDGHFNCAICRQLISSMEPPTPVQLPPRSPAASRCMLFGCHFDGARCDSAVSARFFCGHHECGMRFSNGRNIGCGECGCSCDADVDGHDEGCPCATVENGSPASPTPSTDSLGSLNERVLAHRIV